MRARYFYLTAMLVVLLDQIGKYIALSMLGMGSSYPVFGNWFRITVIGNKGGAFGLLQSFTGLLIVTSVVFVLTVVLLVRNRKGLSLALMLGLSLQLGGSLSNLIDRIRFGYVVDCISIWIWPIFNIADAAIVVGMFFLAYFIFFQDRGQTDSSLRSETGGRGDGESG